MTTSYFRLSDIDLVTWSKLASGRLVDEPERYHVEAAQAAEMRERALAFEAAVRRWKDPSTRTPPASVARKAARASLLEVTRFLVATIEKNPATTDAMRSDLGLRLRKPAVKRAAAAASPLIVVERVDGRRVTLQVRPQGEDAEGAGRGKPRNVQGAVVLAATGPARPGSTDDFHFKRLATRARFQISFAHSAAAGPVWVTAQWYGDRGQLGPMADPVRVDLPAVMLLPGFEETTLAA